MGYRNYIGSMPKREYNKIKSLNNDDLKSFFSKEPDDYIGVYEFGKELYEFGKYVDFNPPKGSVKTFFKNKELHKNYNSDGELNLVTKEFLKYIIDTYINRVRKYYDEMLEPFFEGYKTKSQFIETRKREYDKDYNDIFEGDVNLITKEENIGINKMIDHIKSMQWEWRSYGEEGFPLQFNLDDGKDEITSSWKYEYSIFELVRIYKTFDWKKNIMYYYGY